MCSACGGRVVKRHDLPDFAEVPQVVAHAPAADAAGRVVGMKHELGHVPAVGEEVDQRAVVEPHQGVVAGSEAGKPLEEHGDLFAVVLIGVADRLGRIGGDGLARRLRLVGRSHGEGQVDGLLFARPQRDDLLAGRARGVPLQLAGSAAQDDG